MQIQSIAESLFFTTVRVDTRRSNGDSGSGTGFLFALEVGSNRHIPFVVTNKHVVRGWQGGALTFHQKNGEEVVLERGFRLDIGDWEQSWFDHPDPAIDIAVVPFLALEQYVKQTTGIDLFYRYVTSAMMATPAQIESLDAIEPVTFIGYPNGIWDSKNLLPVARRGTTASPMSVDYEGAPKFLIDASVFGGSSGSPVFVVHNGIIPDKFGNSTLGSRAIFVGVVAAVFFRTALNQIISVPIPTQVNTVPMAQQQEMIDLGIVFKASTVVETAQAWVASHGGA